MAATRKQRPFVMVLVGTLLLGVLAVIALNFRPSLKFPPEQRRPYFTAVAERSDKRISASRKPWKISVGWEVRGKKSYGRIEGEWTKERPAFETAPATRLEADENQTLTFPSGETMALESIQTVYPSGPGSSDHVLQTFDAASFEPQETELSKWNADWFLAKSVYPKIALCFGNGPHRGECELVFENGVPLRQNDSGNPDLYGGSRVYWLVPWYLMPAVLTAEFWYGDVEKTILPIDENAVYQNEDFEISILAAGHFDENGQGALKVGQSGRDYGIAPTFDPIEDPASGFTVVIFRCRRIRDLPGNFGYRSGDAPAEEKPSLTVFDSSEDDVVFTVFPDDAGGPVTRIEFSFQKRATGVFRLSKIPGLPEENYDLDNLFDAKVTYAHFDGNHHNPYQHAWFLPNNLGFKFHYPFSDREFPETIYPIVYQDMTFGEILEDERRRLGVHRFEIDSDGKLAGRLGPWRRLADWTKRKWREIRRMISPP